MPGKDKLFNGDITQPGAAMAPQAFWIQPPSYTLSKADIGQIYLGRLDFGLCATSEFPGCSRLRHELEKVREQTRRGWLEQPAFKLLLWGCT